MNIVNKLHLFGNYMPVSRFLLAFLFVVLPSVAFAQQPTIGGPFELQDHNGKIVTEKSYNGKYLLVSFGYTYCPDVCPTGLQKISDALDGVGDKAEKVQPLFITIDPGRDTVPVLKDYVSNFHPSLVGLTGTAEQIRAAAKVYKVRYRKAEIEGSEPDEYLMDHTAYIYFMAPDGTLLQRFFHRSRVPQITAQMIELIK